MILPLALLGGGMVATVEAHSDTVPESAPAAILRYRVVGAPGYSETDLNTIQTWIIEPRLKAFPGVIAVTGRIGGGGAVEGAVMIRGDRRDAEAEIRRLDQDGTLPPGVRLEKVQPPNLKSGGRREKPASSPEK